MQVNNPVTAASIGAVPTSRQVIAGTNMSGGGTLAADRTFNASGGGFQPALISGNWVSTVPFLTGTSGNAGFNNTIFLYPFVLERAVTISDLGARVNVLGAAGNFQLAIYAHNPATGLPTGNALAFTVNISTAAAGAVSGDIFGPNVTLAAGIYWAASNTDSATAVFQNPTSAALLSYLIGSTTLANLLSAISSVSCFRKIAQTFGTWPSLTAGGTSEVVTSSTNSAFVFWKVA